MAATLNGTPTAVVWAAGINPAAQSITIPANTTAVYMFWSYWASTTGQGINTITLGGNSPSALSELSTNGDANAVGVAAWYNPTTGAQNLDPSWDIAPAEGPSTIVVYTIGGDTTAWRDVDLSAQTDTTANSVTLTTVSGDLVIKFDERYSLNGSQGLGVPALSAGWASAQTQDNNGEGSRVSTISATGSTQVCDSENDYYSCLVAISIPTAPAGGGSFAANYYYR
jgi:hypothetical protein